MATKVFFKVGDRVQYRSGGNWKPYGVIVDEQPAITMNGAVLVGPKYKVRWDDGDESGWLSLHELIAA